MVSHLAGLRLSVVVLALAAAVALGTEWASRLPPQGRTAARGAPVDVDTFLVPQRHDQSGLGDVWRLKVDPLADRRPSPVRETVAPRAGVPTVSSSGRSGHRLTAILISDDRSIAVIDDAVVTVGDRLPDGTRVDAIRNDRVSVVDRDGRKRVLTLTAGRQ